AVTVFDNCAPKSLGAGSYLFFNGLPPMKDLAAAAEPLTQPLIVDWNRVHPLTRYVNFDMVNINKALSVSAPSWIQPIAEGETSPLVFALEREQCQAVVVAFDPLQSDWPLRVSFPIFVSNAIEWLTRARFSTDTFCHPAGATVPLVAPGDEKEAVVETPSGEKRSVDVSEGRTAYFAQTDEIGFYQAQLGSAAHPFAVNLLSGAESNIAPKSEIVLRNQEVKAEAGVLKQNREVWQWFALAFLGVLILEWLIYCRRAWM
ncbi:MAG: hypothetical protein NTW86_32950, partial [Candidatus Sumerlaeota bacterium]|nr:hypothetical protein [Candidatus Sumerlaeota bacterium]